ncbi:3-hydroxyacyl-CoA dehydrogenase [Muricoccus pecuniae]|uniref:3-hydroxyacyl-CoA dehydrogenase n=1 Tax=Muricoccus pecuniae TaxID=693023 RepID=A0A840YIE0_9PROT|nr:3-hydroxyacyl-CoA dehydrogenase [Roseomonas pecuniae]MBB5696277.1 3-hydroxyacyl-CoA dehydrogenase [Roseomonas pecuniae]
MSGPHGLPVAIAGAGSIGVAFALVFARAGLPVRIWDPDEARRSAVPRELRARLADLDDHGLLAEPAEVIAGRVDVQAELAAAVAGVQHVQECAPERAELKRDLFGQLDRLAPAGAVLASSSSFLPASSFASDLPGRGRCLIAHPGNPPYLIPVIEIVPAPFTDEDAATRAEALFAGAGLTPVRVRREVEGFIFNRLQGALLREAYCLVRDGVASVEDVDRVVRDGLGRRWAHIGPFETADLNTRGGIAAHAERMGPSYARMGAERGQDDPWTPELVAQVESERRALLPAEEWEARVAWRDRKLMKALRPNP